MSILDDEIKKSIIESANLVQSITFKTSAEIARILIESGEADLVFDVLTELSNGKTLTEARLLANKK